MSTYKSNDENLSTDMEVYYEIVASEEEIYLEETEEEVIEVLETDNPPSSQNSVRTDPCPAENLDERRIHAAEELITGDSDDPPLSQEAVADMLSTN
jgi:hypothetical protein